MSETAKPTKLRKRRRLVTPPPSEDDILPVDDFYDRSVANTFKDLKSGKVELMEKPSMANQLPSEPTVSLEEQHIINLDPESDDEKLVESSTPDIPVEDCAPASPPLPINKPTRRRKLNDDVKVALNKLSRAQMDLQNSVLDECNQNLAHHTSALTPSSPINETRTKLKVRVKMPSGIVRIELNVADTLYTLCEEIARREATTADRISLFFNDSIIMERDTATSLGLTVADTVEVYILAEGRRTCTNQEEETTKSTKRPLHIKVQGKHGHRDVMNITIGPDDTLDVLMRRFAEFKELDLSSLTFRFDGDLVGSEMTPASLSMEDGDCVDVAINVI